MNDEIEAKEVNTTEVDLTKAETENKTAEAKKTLGNGWFVFYAAMRPIVNVFLLCFSWNQLKPLFKVLGSSNWVLYAYLGTIIIPTVLSVAVFFASFANYARFVKFVIPVVAIETVLIPASTVLQQIIMGQSASVSAVVFAVGVVFMYFVWFRTNKKYFQKRVDAWSKDEDAVKSED